MAERNDAYALDRTRFSALLPSSIVKQAHVLVVGCGNLGSWATIALARLGVECFTLVDPELVEHANLSTQSYRAMDVHTPKVDALRHAMKDFTPDVVCACYVEYFTRGTMAEIETCTGSLLGLPITHVLLTTDTLATRKEAYEIIAASQGIYSPVTILDVRMGARELEIFAFEMSNASAVATYERDLQDTRQSEAPCGARSIAYTGMGAAAFVGELFRRSANDVFTRSIPHDERVGLEDWQAVYRASFEDFTAESYPFVVEVTS